jgi:hypothetical protein
MYSHALNVLNRWIFNFFIIYYLSTLHIFQTIDIENFQ